MAVFFWICPNQKKILDAPLEEDEEVEEQTLTNKITNEEMSVHKPDDESIEIKRAAKKKKNWIDKTLVKMFSSSDWNE